MDYFEKAAAIRKEHGVSPIQGFHDATGPALEALSLEAAGRAAAKIESIIALGKQPSQKRLSQFGQLKKLAGL